MPLLILGAIVAISALAYMFVSDHKALFVRKKPPENDPFKVITLPEDLEEMKRRARSVRYREGGNGEDFGDDEASGDGEVAGETDRAKMSDREN